MSSIAINLLMLLMVEISRSEEFYFGGSLGTESL